MKSCEQITGCFRSSIFEWLGDAIANLLTSRSSGTAGSVRRTQYSATQ